MPINTHEVHFEDEIVQSLTQRGGYVSGSPHDYNREYAVDTVQLFRFLRESQPVEWQKLVTKYGADNAEASFLKRLNKELGSRGMLDILRKGIVDAPAKFSLCYFEPASGMNQTDAARYRSNILSVTRQVHYSPKNENSIDVVLFVNGLPVATLELKNQLSGQSVADAKRQYQNDRDPRELLLGFKSRCLVHFAVDTDEVAMTTRLAGAKTAFLPFNRGNDGGKGNPVGDGTYRTSYLWDDVLAKDSLLDLIRRFVHLESKTDDKGKTTEHLIFPRYHQRDAVRRIIADVRQSGTGSNYLIQHSAGSGKSHTISWLAHHLQSLHDASDKVIFNSVIVITDRRVLDRQLQDTIYQFEHVDGVVEKIDANSKQLASALTTGKKIIITTLQKFPHVIGKVKGLSGKRFAVIVDEAHSSQTGKAAGKMKNILGDHALTEDAMLQRIADEEAQEERETPDVEDIIAQEMATHGRLKNLSFFGFTATPKPKTLEMFGVCDSSSGKHRAFHLYSMRQAIEEGFILDVLQHYTTYDIYFKIGKTISDDPHYATTKANKALGKFLSLHPHSLAQKTQIMVEHFRSVTREKISGRAKAMLVTSSRLHAVRYYLEFQRYIRENGYHNQLGVLVAFSGTVRDDKTNIDYTEPSLNHISEKELPDKFGGDSYHMLIVAEKYQTGFDQPLLHTMFVDKKLHGVKAVQTLSRLNRACEGKTDTFVLDFANTAADIQASFADYYESTALADTTDPNTVYDLKTNLDEFRIYGDSEIEAFAKLFFTGRKDDDLGKLNSMLDPAIERYKTKTEDEQADFASMLTKFVRTYSFVTNIVNLGDAALHKFFGYAACLQRKLPRKDGTRVDLEDEVALQYYRIQKSFEGSIALEQGEALEGGVNAGGKGKDDDSTPLSELIAHLNERFGTEFGRADRLLVDQIAIDLEADSNLRTQAQNNSREHFQYPFSGALKEAVVDRMQQNTAFCEKMLDDEKFRGAVTDWLLPHLYQKLRS